MQLNFSYKHALLVNAIIIGALVCVFIGGYFLGQKIQTDKTVEFFDSYIGSNCQCEVPLEEKDGKITWSKTVNPGNWSLYFIRND